MRSFHTSYATQTDVEVTLKDLPSRDQMTKRLVDDTFDVLIIGGGATGTGIAVDAASRGLKAALVEKEDFASGTSSKSSKLIHGGMRYLEKAVLNLDMDQYKLVKEALGERIHFMRAAPHLNKPLPIILPVYDSYPWVLFWGPYYYIGCKVYDLVAGSDKLLSPSYWLSKAKVLEKFPTIKAEGLKGGTVYYDGLQNDSRMNVALAVTAASLGSVVLNHCQVESLTKNVDGTVCGARVKDLTTGEIINVKAKVVVNAAGPYCDEIRKMDDPSVSNLIVPSTGVHLSLSKAFSGKDTGLIVPKTSDGRILFILPWEHGTIAGTTDTESCITLHPRATEEEVEFILEEMNKIMGVDVTRADVNAVWAGLRPLAKDPKAKNTESISRHHVIEVSPTNLVTICGGKWTTYRKMAEDTVDVVCCQLKIPVRPCVTYSMPLIGAHKYSPALIAELESLGLESDIAENLSSSYGDKCQSVFELGFNERLAPGYPYIEGEVIHAVRFEYAVNAADVFARRVRLGFMDHKACVKSLPRIIELMAREMGWGTRKMVDEYLASRLFLKTMHRKDKNVKSIPNVESSQRLLKSLYKKNIFTKEQIEQLIVSFGKDDEIAYESLEHVFETNPFFVPRKSFFAKNKNELIEMLRQHPDDGVTFDEFIVALAFFLD